MERRLPKLAFVLLTVISAIGCRHNIPGASLNSPSGNRKGTIQENDFNKVIDGKKVRLYTLRNRGIIAMVTNYGGRLVSLLIRGKNNEVVDVVAGFPNIEGYQKSTVPYFGATIGRYANRIAGGRFSLDGKEYSLFINKKPNTLHGGKKGFHDVVWDATQPNGQTVELSYFSRDMEEGFPGNLKVKVTYELTDYGALKISYEASTDKKTVINLTNHTFFNLNGEASGTILNHFLKINAASYTPVDSTLIPTGKIASVRGTPFDFTKGATIGSRINVADEQLRLGKGYDINFVLNPHDVRQPMATVIGDKSNIRMDIYTDQPGLQFYSGNFMKSRNVMKGGHRDDFRTAFVIEPQHFPDSPNNPDFPSTVLAPSMKYRSESVYKFSTVSNNQ